MVNSILNAFISYILSKVGCSLYVWGAQGESISSVIKEWVTKRETSTANINRVTTLLGQLLNEELYFYDCSGLSVAWLLEQGLIKYDMTANGLYNQCTKINKSQVKRGDWVFILNNSGNATHIGYIVDNKLNVVESAGRNHGVIKRSLQQGSPNGMWNAFGRPEKIFPELAQDNNLSDINDAMAFYRILKLTSPRMKGEDVRLLQKAIGADIDGIFGPDTEKILKLIQKKLFPNDSNEWDGIAGKRTYLALGFKWNN